LVIERIILNEILESVTLTAYIQTNAISPRDNLQCWNRPAVIICPGGGYLSLAEDEAEFVALQFLANGYQAFILNYSIGAPYAHFPAPFLDLANSVITVRKNAKRFAVDPNKVTVLGLSNGGHVASMLGTLWHTSLFPDKLAKPSAMILGFPVLDLVAFETKLLERNSDYAHFIEMMATATLGMKTFQSEKAAQWNSITAVSDDTIPTFIWSYRSDEMVDHAQIDAFTHALKANRIPYETYILPNGKHGSVASTSKPGWLESAIEWLDSLYTNK